MQQKTLPPTYREQLRATFTENAELYDRMRPRCPPELFNDLATLARLGPDSWVLEIGPGTGQATLPLAQLGCSILTVELGAEMAEVARHNLSSFPKVEVDVSAFEDWPLPKQKFDLVVSANAFHWIDENVRMSKAADALREGGALAIISTHHIKVALKRSSMQSSLSTKYMGLHHTLVSLFPRRRLSQKTDQILHERRGSEKLNSEGVSGRVGTRPANTLICCRHIRTTIFYRRTQRKSSWEKFPT